MRTKRLKIDTNKVDSLKQNGKQVFTFAPPKYDSDVMAIDVLVNGLKWDEKEFSYTKPKGKITRTYLMEYRNNMFIIYEDVEKDLPNVYGIAIFKELKLALDAWWGVSLDITSYEESANAA